jgi:hypothetical protein
MVLMVDMDATGLDAKQDFCDQSYKPQEVPIA